MNASDRTPITSPSDAALLECVATSGNVRSPDDDMARRAAHLPHADPPLDLRGVVHLGDQHVVPPRRRPLQHRSVHRQRLLHRRDGALRGADRCRRRYPRETGVLPAGNGNVARLDAALSDHVADPGAVLGLGDRLTHDRAGVHVLLRRRRGVAGRRAGGHRVRPCARDGVCPRPGRDGPRHAVRVGRRGVHRAGHEPGCAVRSAGGGAGRHVRCCRHLHEGPRFHAQGGREPRQGGQEGSCGLPSRTALATARSAG